MADRLHTVADQLQAILERLYTDGLDADTPSAAYAYGLAHHAVTQARDHWMAYHADEQERIPRCFDDSDP